MSKKEYTFISANKGEVNVIVVGEYHDGCKDIEVSFGGYDDLHEERFDEIDDADVVMRWLFDNGVRFEAKRSAVFNREYIQSVLIDEDATVGRVWSDVDAMADTMIDRKYEDITGEMQLRVPYSDDELIGIIGHPLNEQSLVEMRDAFTFVDPVTGTRCWMEGTKPYEEAQRRAEPPASIDSDTIFKMLGM